MRIHEVRRRKFHSGDGGIRTRNSWCGAGIQIRCVCQFRHIPVSGSWGVGPSNLAPWDSDLPVFLLQQIRRTAGDDPDPGQGRSALRGSLANTPVWRRWKRKRLVIARPWVRVPPPALL
jgi:hypothetical protein